MTTHDAIIALADGPLAGQLSGLEAAVLIQHIRRADVDGVSFPSSDAIAGRLRHKDGNHVRAARARLVKLGVLERLPRRPGHSGRLVAPYRLNVMAFAPAEEGHV